MSTLPPSWATDLAVRALSGSSVEDRGDHFLLRTPSNPTFHWGNCLLVTDADAVDDTGRWAAAFAVAFPDADWCAIGLARMPADVEAWSRLGLEVELDEVLTTATLPRPTDPPAGYAVRFLGRDRLGSQRLPRHPRERGDRRVRRERAHAVRACAGADAARPVQPRRGGVRRRLRRAKRWWPSWASCAAARRPAISTSAPTSSTEGRALPRTCSGSRRGGPPAEAAPAGSS